VPRQEDVARELARARERARARADAEPGPRASQAVESGPSPLLETAPHAAEPVASALPEPPDNAAVNQAWRPPPMEGRGVLGLLRRAAHVLLRPQLDSRVRFDSEQVRFDNELRAYLVAHLSELYRRSDSMAAEAAARGRRSEEAQQQVHQRVTAALRELGERMELVLETAERSRLSSEADLRRLPSRLEALERRVEELERALRR
jgi:hypothetical protein